MGISGLLPLLKSVQKPTHLSELAGKTIAVDAYVWLHRGAYSCATELVTGVPTTKYVEYAMHRVRLLRYYKITPYVVFDGAPLPAKKGTESERKRKRDENLTLAKTLARQGKNSHARDHYVKCVDITPQMAFQLIKALRAEQVPYLVAPYEADAQLFYLEKTGLVNGILTEDSDLLIFGTQLLLLKLDFSTAMCTAIAANSLGSNSSADLPLHGWGVKELRECAMLSGCDYIEGVRGVGLKTASKYLRKWGTIEKALRALRMDGKSVERDWEERMKKAEVGFLNQRVWDPRKEEIVYLTEPDWATWNEEREKYVGSYIDVGVASAIARGDVDPLTFEPMVDIMPSFHPVKHPIQSRPLVPKDYNRRDVTDSKNVLRDKGSLLQYFAKRPKNSNIQAVASPAMSSFASTLQASRASGKRTLSDQYDRETTAKRQKLAKDSVDESFDQDGKCSTSIPVSSSSRICNTVVFDDDKEDLEELEGLDEVCEAFQFPMKQEVDMVQQEEGYLSPPISSPGRMDGENGSQRDATPDFSSPLQWRTNAALVQRRKVGPQTTPRLGGNGMGATLASQTAELDDESSQWDSDDRVTSPPTALKHHAEVSNKMEVEQSQLYISELLASNAQSTKNPSCDTFTVDLCDIFVDTGGSEIDTEISSPGTALEEEPIECARARLDDVDDDEAALRMLQRHKVVAAGWEQKFSNTPRLGFHDKGGKPTTTTVQKRAKARPRVALARRDTIATLFHPGVPRQTNRPRRSTSLSFARNRTSSGVLLASGSTPHTRSGPKDMDIATTTSPSNVLVDDLDSTAMGLSTMKKLQAYRFR